MANGFKGLLVTPEQKQQAAYQGLLNLGTQLMATGGYSDRPTSFAQALGQGGQGFMQGYQGSLDRARQQQMQNMHAQSKQMELDKLRVQQEREKSIQDWVSGGRKGDMPTTPEMEIFKWQQRQTAPKDTRTSLQKDYEAAKSGGFKGTITDFMVTKGMAGAGYAPSYGPQGSVTFAPAPGTPEAIEAAGALAKKEKSKKVVQTSANVVVEDINRAFGLLDEYKDSLIPITGRAGEAAAMAGYGDAVSLQNLLNTVKANSGFDRLQQMREASPTGGALGAVSENENKLLQSALGSVEQSQNDEQLAYNLARVQNIYMDIIHGEGKGPERLDPAEVSKRYMNGGGAKDNELDALMQKYGG